MDLELVKKKVKDLATDAVKLDKLEDYEKAYDLYIKAANYLQLLIKYDPNPYNKKIYTEKAKDYCLRAKEIRDKVINKKKPSKDDENSDDEEKKN